MIKAKNKKCVECGREDLPHFSKGRCKYCASKSYKGFNPPKIKDKTELNDFYEEAINIAKKHPYSFETGEYIGDITRANIAHLFPKRKYKSLATNHDNVVLLTLEQHTIFDDYLDKMQLDKVQKFFPNTYKKLISVFEKYQNEIEECKLKHEIQNHCLYIS